MNEDKLHVDGDFGGNRLKPSDLSQLLDTRRVAKVSHIDNQLACNLRHGVPSRTTVSGTSSMTVLPLASSVRA